MHEQTDVNNGQLARYRIDTGRHFHLEIIADRSGGNALTLAQETQLLCRNLDDLITALGVKKATGLVSNHQPPSYTLGKTEELKEVFWPRMLGVPLVGIVDHLNVPSEMSEILEELRRGEDGSLDTSPIGGDPNKDYAAALQFVQLGLQALDEALPNGQRTRAAVGYESMAIGLYKLAEFLKEKGLFDKDLRGSARPGVELETAEQLQERLK